MRFANRWNGILRCRLLPYFYGFTHRSFAAVSGRMARTNTDLAKDFWCIARHGVSSGLARK